MQNKLTSLLTFAIIYLIFGCVTVALVFPSLPRLSLLMAILSFNIPVASALSWCLVCRGINKISFWRAGVVGCLAGILVVPLFWFFGELLTNGCFPGFLEIISACIFFPVLFGITAPMGVAAILAVFYFTSRKELAEELESTVGRSDLTVSENPYNPPLSQW